MSNRWPNEFKLVALSRNRGKLARATDSFPRPRVFSRTIQNVEINSRKIRISQPGKQTRKSAPLIVVQSRVHGTFSTRNFNAKEKDQYNLNVQSVYVKVDIDSYVVYLRANRVSSLFRLFSFFRTKCRATRRSLLIAVEEKHGHDPHPRNVAYSYFLYY